MKNATYVLAALAILALASCGKKNTTPTSYGTWSMKGANYTVKSCGFIDDVMYATNGTADTLFIIFANGATPTASGDYQMQFTNPGTGQASVQVYFHGQYYLPGNSTQTIHATVTNGKVSSTGNHIYLADPSNLSDTASVVFNITQQ